MSKTEKCELYDNFSYEKLFFSLLEVPLKNISSPIVFSPSYDICLAGIEKFYPFDTCKPSRIVNRLKELEILTEEEIVEPNELQPHQIFHFHPPPHSDLLKLSTLVEGFHNSNITDSSFVSKYADLSSLTLLPWFIVNNRLLRPLRFQASGTILAAKLSLKFGWSLNMGGGFNHCQATKPGSYSPYDDISMATSYLLEKVNHVMIIDLSAQQCNGPSRRWAGDERVHILDIFNQEVYPFDGFAKRGVSTRGVLRNNCSSGEYLALVKSKLDEALSNFKPDVVIYVAGVDVFQEDLSGGLSLSANAIIERDQMIFLKIKSRGIPIIMLTGSGFYPFSSSITADSICNLQKFGLISIVSEEIKSEIQKKNKNNKKL